VHLPGDVAGKGEWRAMMAHELLRQAAQILGAGWSKIADARDDTGRIVPLLAMLRAASLISYRRQHNTLLASVRTMPGIHHRNPATVPSSLRIVNVSVSFNT
jgi:hypothetical protein